MKTFFIGVLLFVSFIIAGKNRFFSLDRPLKIMLVKNVMDGANNTPANFSLNDTTNGTVSKLPFQLRFVPDVNLQVATGEYIQLQKLIDCKHYIFINIWTGRKLDVKRVQTIDSIATIYKNKLLVIDLLDKGSMFQLNRLIRKHQLKNMQGLLPDDMQPYVKNCSYPYGILFSKTGKLIETGMDGGALAMFMEKHVGRKAKF